MLQLLGTGVIDEKAVSLRDDPHIAVLVSGHIDGMGIALVDEIGSQYRKVVDGITAYVKIVQHALVVVHVIVSAVIRIDGFTAHLNGKTFHFTRFGNHCISSGGGDDQQLPLVREKSRHRIPFDDGL